MVRKTLFWGLVCISLYSCDEGNKDGVDDNNTEDNLSPIAEFFIVRDVANTIDLDASNSVDEDGAIVDYNWTFGDGNTGQGKTTRHVYESPGCYDVSLEVVDDKGVVATKRGVFRVLAASSEGGIEPSLFSGFPNDGQVLPRSIGAKEDIGLFTVESLTAIEEFETLSLRIYADNEMKRETSVELCNDQAALSQWILPVRENHRVELVAKALGNETLVMEAERIVAGDFILINGQSNAFSREFGGSADENLDEFVRSYGSRTEDVLLHESDESWHQAVVGGLTEEVGAVGQWPLRMASQLSQRHNVPIALINSARGGRPIDYFQKNDADPMDSTTNYGRLLSRASRSGGIQKIRAILFYQGEAERGDFQVHDSGFRALHEDWLQDFPTNEIFYVTQIRQGCGGEVETRNVQRLFANILEKTTVMTTTGLDGHDGCHFAYENGYKLLGDWYTNLLSRDLYGESSKTDIEAIDVESAQLMGDTIRIKTKSDATTITVDPGIENDFNLEGGTRTIVSVEVDGLDLVVTLSPGGTDPTVVSYNGHPGPGPWIKNARGLGLLAFRLELE